MIMHTSSIGSRGASANDVVDPTILSVFGKRIFGKTKKNPQGMGGKRGKISPKFWQKVYLKKSEIIVTKTC